MGEEWCRHEVWVLQFSSTKSIQTFEVEQKIWKKLIVEEIFEPLHATELYSVIRTSSLQRPCSLSAIRVRVIGDLLGCEQVFQGPEMGRDLTRIDRLSSIYTEKSFLGRKYMQCVALTNSQNFFLGRKCQQCMPTHRIYFREGNVGSACTLTEFISGKEIWAVCSVLNPNPSLCNLT